MFLSSRLAHSAVVLASCAAAAYVPTAERHFSDVHVRVERKDSLSVTASVSSSEDGANPIATVAYTNSINQTGWAYLTVVANASYSDEQMAYYSGYVEGYTTFESIALFIVNTGNNFTWDAKLGAFLEANEAFVRTSIDANPTDPYWHAISLVRHQLAGLYWGYVDAATASGVGAADIYPFTAFMNIQLGGDLEDLAAAVGLQADPGLTHLPRHPRIEAKGSASTSSSRPRRRVHPGGWVDPDSGHCSALVKLLPGNKELFSSQVTWSSLESMMRIYKTYTLPYSLAGDKASGTVPAATMTFSSYPASLFSGDDWYQMSSGLVMLETTIGNSNATLYQLYVKPSTVLEWTRNIVANRLAADGPTWVEVYSRLNSGSYNNENVVINYNLFKPGQPLPDGVLTVADQVPGYIVSGDLTYYLRQYGYLPSYNLPVFPFIYNISGDYQAYVAGGDWFSYNNTARAQIFARNQSFVVDEASFRALMRYNDYRHDPISTQGCGTTPPFSAENAIGARDDLNPAGGVYPISALGHRDHAGIDAKYTTWAMMTGQPSPLTGQSTPPLSTGAQSGPSYDQQPAFVFSQSDYGKTTSHVGLPDSWTFPWVTINPGTAAAAGH